MFYTFREHILPDMFDIFAEDFWSIMIPQASQVYPSVWHAAVASATVKSVLLIKTNGTEPMTRDREAALYGYALKHCNKSIQYLTKIQPPTATFADQEMLLLTCILLICYSSLRGNHAETLTHFCNGLRLCKTWQRRDDSCGASKSQRLPNCVTTMASIDIRFQRLEVLVMLAPFKLAIPATSSSETPISPDVPFSSSRDAYLELLCIDAKWKKIIRSDVTAFGDTKLQFISDECQSLRLPFRIWQRKFHALQASMPPGMRTGETNRVEEARRSAMHLLELTLEAMTSVDTTIGEIAWDSFNANFERVIDFAGRVAQDLGLVRVKKLGNEKATLSDSSQLRSLFGLPLVAVGVFCRIPHLRRKAVAMLKAFPFLDGVFKSTFFVDAIDQIIWLEEQGMMLDPIEEGCECILDKFICNAHRVCQIVMSPDRIMLRTGYDVTLDRAGLEVNVLEN